MCSSWVRGEAHAQFQGEGAVAIRLPYPTAVLAFDEGYQSEGLQLLAWHIEASNARSGSGSRDISQEDSRENSSLSKCHCSVAVLYSDQCFHRSEGLEARLRD